MISWISQMCLTNFIQSALQLRHATTAGETDEEEVKHEKPYNKIS